MTGYRTLAAPVRRQAEHRCSRCSQVGHNSRKCPERWGTVLPAPRAVDALGEITYREPVTPTPKAEADRAHLHRLALELRHGLVLLADQERDPEVALPWAQAAKCLAYVITRLEAK